MKKNSLIFLLLILNSFSLYSQLRVEKFDIKKEFTIHIEAENLYFESLIETALEDYGFKIAYNFRKEDKEVYILKIFGSKRPAVRCGGNIILDLNGRFIESSTNNKIGSFYFSQDLLGGLCPTVVADRIAEKLRRNRI